MAVIHGINKDIRGMLVEYTASDNKNLLTTIIDTYVKDLLPEVENLRRLKHDIIEMNYEMNLNSPNMSTLYQSEVALSKCEYLYGEPPNVIRFSV